MKRTLDSHCSIISQLPNAQFTFNGLLERHACQEEETHSYQTSSMSNVISGPQQCHPEPHVQSRVGPSPHDLIVFLASIVLVTIVVAMTPRPHDVTSQTTRLTS